MKLEIKDLCFDYGKNDILKNICLQIKPMITVIIGPNGAGKSTLIKCIAGLFPVKGSIVFNGNLISPAYKEFHSQIMSYLPQTADSYTNITVFEAVLLGLLNSLSLRVSDEELGRVDALLNDFEIQELSQRQLNELSGGQKQMVHIAQAIIKDPKVILLDEPLNSLDIHHQFEILNLLRNLTDQKKMITVIAMHDLNLAAKYADHIVVMHNGEIHSCGKPCDVLTTEMIRTVYRVEAEVYVDSSGVPFINPVQCLSSMCRDMV